MRGFNYPILQKVNRSTPAFLSYLTLKVLQLLKFVAGEAPDALVYTRLRTVNVPLANFLVLWNRLLALFAVEIFPLLVLI